MTETIARPEQTSDAPPVVHKKGATLAAVSLGVMMVGLDGTVVGVANPTISRDLGASLAGLQWVTNGYLLALAVLLVVGGKLGDRFGRKKVFLTGVVGFGIASAGCAISTSIELLVVFRVLQGIAGALLLPTTLAIIRAAFPPEELNKALGIWGGTSALAVASGPIIGGLLVEHVSWESIFLLNLPLGALALLVGLRSITETNEPEAGGFDFPGVALLTGSLFAVVWGLIKAQDHGWGSAYVLGFLVAGLVLIAAFIVREQRAAAPLIPLDLFRSRSLSAGVVLVVAGFFALFGVLFFVTLYLQSVGGYSPVEAGIRTLPLTGVFVLSAPLGGTLTEKLGPRPPLVIGMVLMAVSFLLLTRLEVDSSYSALWPAFLMIGVALGLVVVASTQAIVGNAPVERAGVAGGVQSTANQLGGVLGTAVLGSLIVSKVSSTFGGHLSDAGVPADVAARLGEAKEAVSQGVAPVSREMSADLVQRVTLASNETFLDGLHLAMGVGAGVAVLGILLALLVKPGHAVEGGAAL